MAWTTPRTWVTGELVTAAILNTYVRDNQDALDDGRLAIASQAAGDIVYASSSTALARVAIGTANKVLTSSGSAPQWSTQVVNAALPTNIDVGGTLDVTGVAKFDNEVGFGVTPTGGDVCIDAANSSTPTVRFENSDGTVDAAIDTWDSASNIQLWIGANEYLNGGSPARFNASYDTAAIELTAEGNINLRTGDGATTTTRVSVDKAGAVVMGTSLKVNPGGALVASDGVILGRTTSNHLMTLESDRDDDNGATVNLRLDSASPGNNDEPGRIHVYGRDDNNTDRNVVRIDIRQDDVATASQDSSIRFSVQNNSSGGTNAVASLSSTGVWSDASDEEAKEYTGSITERGSSGTVLDRIARLETGIYHTKNLPAGKEAEYHAGPSAQQLWREFGLGKDPTAHEPGIAAKDLAAIALAGLQQLIIQNEELKQRIVNLEEKLSTEGEGE